MLIARYVLLVCMTAAVIACSPKTIMVGQMTDLVDDGMIAFERDDDLQLLENAIPANIKLLEALLANSPDNRRLITLLSRFYGSYAFGFVETRLEERLFAGPAGRSRGPETDRLKDQLNRCYLKGAGYALMALEKSVPGAADAFRQVDTIGPYLERLGDRQVAALFWYGFNLGAWVNRNLDSVRAVSRAHLARQVMERVAEINPVYHHAGAHLFLMAYFGSRPPMMGGSQEKARGHYRRLKQIAGDAYLLADLFYGRYCLPQQQARDAFVDLMQRIVDHPTGECDVSLYNAIAGRRAAIYLSAVDLLFE
ncbi:hypothetical protein DSCA_07440 [Desulfosarcina alkanivorans]|jgi:hypothetical protein|uniref:DUF4034 domain-containing protein n=1 Tax=Desulfosarcina alkanivorans TaxID=571177 RepID=A0A5K7YKJ1_9BACT|nr:TRAP transporter TatT component family protein [Desulfosarcina alkanivorans]BBO66814.1 hypothetical protein DSCA_07440 [Desulfosarcina alkanivorans]